MVGPLGGGGHLPIRPVGPPDEGVRHRHATTDGVGLPAHGSHVLVHPHRRRRSLPTDARLRGLLPHGLGRQRPADRAPGAELLRRPLRSRPPLRPVLLAPREAGPGHHLGVAAELHRAVRTLGRRGREGLRAPVANTGPVGGLEPDLHHHRRHVASHVTALLPPDARLRARVLGGSAHPVGRGLPDGRVSGRDRGPRARRRVPPGAVRTGGNRRRGRDRNDAPRTASRVRGTGHPPRGRPPPRPRRSRRGDTLVQGPRARPRPPPRRPRQGLGHRHDLHLR